MARATSEATIPTIGPQIEAKMTPAKMAQENAANGGAGNQRPLEGGLLRGWWNARRALRVLNGGFARNSCSSAVLRALPGGAA
jgi:hypothetical protein